FNTEATPPCAQLELLSPCHVLLRTLMQRSVLLSARITATVIQSTPLSIIRTSWFFIFRFSLSDTIHIAQQRNQSDLVFINDLIQIGIKIPVRDVIAIEYIAQIETDQAVAFGMIDFVIHPEIGFQYIG